MRLLYLQHFSASSASTYVGFCARNTPHVALEFIGQVFRIQCGTICKHWPEYKARRNETKHAGRPPALSSQELEEIIAHILHGFQQR
jgi:hypothetical protein